MNHEDSLNGTTEKAFRNELGKEDLFASLKAYVGEYERIRDIDYRMGMAYKFAGIMGSDAYRNHLSQDAVIAEALELCGRLEIDREVDSDDWTRLKALLSF